MQQEKDFHTFTPPSPSPHRLPTRSLNESLQKTISARRHTVSTGLPALDEVLQTESTSTLCPSIKGLGRGQVTEIYGPSGVGKTALAIQAAASALHAGNSVVWIDGSHTLAGSRLRDVLSHYKLPEGVDPPSSSTVARPLEELLERFHHFTTPTLAHLLALICHPNAAFPPDETSLIVIDSVSTLFAAAYPSNTPKISGNRPIVNKKYDVAHWAANRRWSVLAEFTAAISKLASAKNLVVLLLSQVNTKFRRGAPATLRPALHTKSWTKSVDTRIVLFRDWLEASEEPDARETRAGVRFASIAKFRAVSYAQLGNVVPFRIEKAGVKQLELPSTVVGQESRKSRASSPVKNLSAAPVQPSLKRKRDEIADSESEDCSDDDFGWVEDDELELVGVFDVHAETVV